MPPKKAIKKATAKKMAAANKTAAPKVEPCTYHPPNRIIGGHCMVCDSPVAKK